MSQTNTDPTMSHEDKSAYLIFRLNDSDYAIPVEHVQEIITSIETSPVPGSPDYLEGVVNLRGRILPIVDLRKRFKLSEDFVSDRQCYVILMWELDGELTELGIKVDGVAEVARIAASQIDSANGMHDYNDSLVFTGVAKTESGIKLILDSRILVEQLKKDVRTQFQVTGQTSSVEANSPQEPVATTA